MSDFVADVTRADGNVIQIGDNDSGRFFKLPGSYRLTTCAEMRQRYRQLDSWHELPDSASCPDENVLNHSELIDALRGLAGTSTGLTGRLVLSLARGRTFPTKRSERVAMYLRVGNEAVLLQALRELQALPKAQRQTYRFSKPPTEEIRAFAYRSFGLYGWRGGAWSAWVRCGTVGQGGLGGHAHNDALSLELEIGEVLLASDPGTYVYTSDPAARNRYRSAHAHFVPRIADREPASLREGLFVLPDTPGLRCRYFSERGFIGEHLGYGAKVLRVVLIEDDAIVVQDGSWGERLERCNLPSSLPISPKYGALLR